MGNPIIKYDGKQRQAVVPFVSGKQKSDGSIDLLITGVAIVGSRRLIVECGSSRTLMLVVVVLPTLTMISSSCINMDTDIRIPIRIESPEMIHLNFTGIIVARFETLRTIESNIFAV